VRYRPRRLAATLKRALRTFPAALVTGARQSGKTTLLRNELPRHQYVSLERPDARARALSDPEGFLSEPGVPLVLDEIQYAPVLLHYIKDRIDADRRPGRYVLTGSQTFALMRGVSQSLAGRVAVLSLDPLSAGEAGGAPEATSPDRLLARVFGQGGRNRHHGTPPDAADWLLRGGYPEPRLNRRVDRELWFSSYVQTYLERDVRDLVRVTDLESFRSLLFLARPAPARSSTSPSWAASPGSPPLR
jgi:predicted AAA+ superfamily ATPase